MNNKNDDWEKTAILSAYNNIKIKIPDLKIDSLKVVKSVIAHRNCFKPSTVKTLLLAESHVFTSDAENDIILDYPDHRVFYDFPKQFVRLVYCLGYGECDLATEIPPKDNPGTWQYWKIFAACGANSFEDFEAEVEKVQKGTCNEFGQRLINKIILLRKLMSKGVWLVDSCIVSLYGLEEKPKPEYRSKGILISWRNYISKLIERTNPEHIIVIGKGVYSTLEEYLKSMNIDYTVVPQPQKHMDSQEIEEIHKIYNSICNR